MRVTQIGVEFVTRVPAGRRVISMIAEIGDESPEEATQRLDDLVRVAAGVPSRAHDAAVALLNQTDDAHHRLRQAQAGAYYQRNEALDKHKQAAEQRALAEQGIDPAAHTSWAQTCTDQAKAIEDDLPRQLTEILRLKDEAARVEERQDVIEARALTGRKIPKPWVPPMPEGGR